MPNRQKEKVTIPKDLLKELITTRKKWDNAKEHLEDYLIANHPEWKEDLLAADKDYNSGKTETLDEFLEEESIEI